MVSLVDEDEWSAPRYGRFIPDVRVPVTAGARR
jgi:hypothetical protein